MCLGLGFQARKEGRERGGRGRREVQESKRRKRSSEARENLVILRTAASLMDTVCVCVVCMSVFQGGVGQQERAVFIQSVPCLNHVVGKTTGRLPVRSRRTQRPSERVEETGETERSRPQGWPGNLLVQRECECMSSAYVCAH